ncbi:MAG: Dabb family protein [Planctomycetota bacterium]
MLKNLLCWAVLVVACAGCGCPRSQKSCPFSKLECKKDARLLRHVVLFKFKEGTTPEKIKEVENAFASLPGKISEIKRFEWGTNVSPENRADGFTHCFLLTFLNEADRDAYLVHPDHKGFGKALGGCLDKVLVVDYWTGS